ncbi:MAG TPA: L-histidine N(alpha)-methyltransferase [Acidimicrobiales bacterium]|nr:L-histidine N(alpha)-methyltransferase [Acidimicrobiales bacterium]
MSATVLPVIDVYLRPEDTQRALADDVRTGLSARPKELPPKWFYDEQGSELFDKITRLPEYYPTEAERSILAEHSSFIADLSDADTLVELGAGSADKTRVLLDALRSRGSLERYVPFDVSESALIGAAKMIAGYYPGLEVHGVVGDFDHHLDAIPGGGTRLIAFLGGTIGNFDPAARTRFFAQINSQMSAHDTFLLGVDLVKDPARLVSAYDDETGVTAAFNKNVLAVINRSLGGSFDLERFDHVALWDPVNEWIEMRLRSIEKQRVTVRDIGLTVDFAAGEEMRTEISAKFRRERISRELASAGLELVAWLPDTAGDYALILTRCSSRASP